MLTSRPKEINKGKIVSNQYYKTQDNVHVVINLHVWVGLERCSLGKWNFSPFPVPVCSSATGAAICGGARWTPVKFPQQLRIRASARAPFYNLFTVLLLSSSTLCWAGNFFTVRRLAGVTVAIFLRSLASYLCNVISYALRATRSPRPGTDRGSSLFEPEGVCFRNVYTIVFEALLFLFPAGHLRECSSRRLTSFPTIAQAGNDLCLSYPPWRMLTRASPPCLITT